MLIRFLGWGVVKGIQIYLIDIERECVTDA